MTDLNTVYESLRDKYDLILTTTRALNDEYTIDVPVIRGVSDNRKFDLYKDDGIFVFSFTLFDERGESSSHTHPYDTNDAINCIEKFMSKSGVWTL